MAGDRIKPFRFENLEHLTRREVELRAALTRYLPEALPAASFLPDMIRELEKYTNDRVRLELTALREPKFGKYRASIPDPTILFVLTAAPLEKKAILQIDFALAHILVDRMLGGVGEYPEDLRPITPIEEGVLQFLVLKILTLLARAAGSSEVQFRLDSIITEPAKLAALGDDEEMMALLSIQLTIGKKAGFVRLALPHPMVEGLLKVLSPQERMLNAADLKRLENIADIKMPIWIELGSIEIGHLDLTRLEVGDVVLFDQVNVELGESGLQGPVVLRVREGVGGGFQGHITESRPEAIAVQIDGVF